MTIEDRALVPLTNLFGAPSAVAVIEAAADLAKPLAALIEDRGLYSNISGRKHVRVEGWTLLGSMLGVYPVVIWSRPLEGGWEARVEARTRDGAVIGAAEAECLREERNWSDRDDYAIRSMAQTRATSKALRLPLGFVIQLAGFETTPAEEMDGVVVVTGPPCPHCGAPVLFNEEKTRGRKPVWSCQNRGCGGGSPRDKNDPGKGNWPWGSYDPDYFAEGGGEIIHGELSGPGATPPESWDSASLIALGIDEQQARAELEAFTRHPGFAAGTVAEIRGRIERATTLLVALGEPDGLLGELWAEFKADKPDLTTFSVAKAHAVMDFARFVQDYLRVR
jgi:hypothetical protein